MPGRLSLPRPDRPIPKSELIPGEYYKGVCRNARIARWDGAKFWHWRTKFGSTFLESIRHREDDEIWDVFDAEAVLKEEDVEHKIDLPTLYNS